MALIRAVLFDFGGVIVRTEDPAGRRAWEARLGLAAGQLSDLVFNSDTALAATTGAVPKARVWQHVAATLNLDAGQIERLQADFWSGDRLDSELIRFIRGLRPAYRTAILSNAWSNGREVIGRDFGLDDAVDRIIVSAEEGLAKPDARLYRRAAQRLGVVPGESLFVDDHAPNVEGARDAGMQAVHFRSRGQALDEIQQLLNGARTHNEPTKHDT